MTFKLTVQSASSWRPRAAAIGMLSLITALLAGCGSSDDPNEDKSPGPPAPAERSVGGLRLIGQQVLARRSDFAGTVVGGLSGIDYDAANRRYVLLSDDRSSADSANPPRIYFANLTFDTSTFSAIQFTSTVRLKQPDGSDYPKLPTANVADPEGIRFDPVSGNLVFVSEGDRTLTESPPRIVNPFVREVRTDGTAVREYALPTAFRMSAQGTGPRGNQAFEGVTFTPDRNKAVVIAEGPLFEDGQLPTISSGAVSRITVFDRERGTATAQYAYRLDRIQAEPVPAGQFSVNGATEILAVTDTKFLVLERSFSFGVVGNQVRLYEIDISRASNILNTGSLVSASYTPVTKRLVLDFETLKAQLGGIANLEGITFGPRLANGRDSLVVVADDNFPTADSATDRNQFIVFEVLP